MQRVPQDKDYGPIFTDVWNSGPYALMEMTDDELHRFIRNSRWLMVIAIAHARRRRQEAREAAL